MAVPRFNFWGKFRPVIETKKLRKTITLEDFTARCGPQLGSMYLASSAGGRASYANHTSVAQAALDFDFNVTIEGWFKFESFSAGYVIALTDTIALNSTYMQLGVDGNGKIVCNVLIGAAMATSTSIVPQGQWAHICAVYNGTDIRLYLNGELAGTPVAYTQDLILSTPVVMFNPLAAVTNYYTAECRIWKGARTAHQIYASYKHRRDLGTIDTSLKFYYKFNEKINDSLITTEEAISGENFSIIAASQSGSGITYDENPPLIYGASFIVAQYNVTLPYKSAIQFPVMFPSDIDFMLVVRWTDSDNVTQRRRLNDMEGVDIAPFPAKYAGETLPLSYVFEVWNVDGASSITLSTDLVIYTSLTSQPTSDTDHVNVVAVTNPTIDTTLGEPFPVTSFPLEFDTQQTY